LCHGLGETYEFYFHANIWGSILFSCDFTSDHHSKTTSMIANYGAMPCTYNWAINPSGFYFKWQVYDGMAKQYEHG
jgi:hypothetical protein